MKNNSRKSLVMMIFVGILFFAAGFLFWSGLYKINSEKPVMRQKQEQAAADQQKEEAAKATENAANNRVNGSDWYLILVNKEHPIPEDFTVSLQGISNGHAVDKRVYPALQAMLEAARREGLSPVICSSYRTNEKQTDLYWKRVRKCLAEGDSEEEAEREAGRWVAVPGTSEHQTGLAVDIVDESYQILDEKQESTGVQKWLMENAYRFGFILRYPTEKSGITGIGYEPWHYRYVGIKAAKEIREKGVCLEEYLGYAG